MRVVAELLAAETSQTPMGGRAVFYRELGVIWLTAGTRRRREAGPGETRHDGETLTAEARVDTRLATGRILRFGGADWRVQLINDAGPGRVRLELERGA